MRTISLSQAIVVAFLASTQLLSQQPAAPPPPANPPTQTEPSQPAPSRQEPANPASSPAESAQKPVEPAQKPTTPSSADDSAKSPAGSAHPLPSPQKKAWQILNAACAGDKTGSRVIATRVLGLIPNNPRARLLAEKALSDDKPEVRSAAAAAIGDMKSKASIPLLKKTLEDDDPSVALAAAHSLDLMHDDSAYELYYEILSGQRKSGKGLIASQTAILKDPKKMAELGFEQGIGYIPFAGIGWEAIKVIKKDDSSPVRAAAAKVLASDPDPDAMKALADAVGDKSWLVRAAAIEALARRGDPSALDTLGPYMFDEKDAVKFTAAAAVVRLTTVKEEKDRKKKKPQ